MWSCICCFCVSGTGLWKKMSSDRHSWASEHNSLTLDVSAETKANKADMEHEQNGKVVAGADESVGLRDICSSWRVVIMISSFLNCCIVGCMFISFSIFYMSFVEHFEAESAATGWVGSLFLATGSILGKSSDIL